MVALNACNNGQSICFGGESSFQFIKLTENLRSTFEPTIYFSKFTIYFSDFHIHSPDAPAHRRPLIKNPFSLFTHIFGHNCTAVPTFEGTKKFIVIPKLLLTVSNSESRTKRQETMQCLKVSSCA